jgi:hypothetical protein
MNPVLYDAFLKELAAADNARQFGLEGRARVCTRRASAMIIRAYYQKNNPSNIVTGSTISLLQQLRDDPEVSDTARLTAAHLLQQVDKEFNLTPDIDLIAETRTLPKLLKLNVETRPGDLK